MRLIRAEGHPFVPASHEDPQRPGVWKRVLATHADLLAGRVQMINWARLPIGASFRAHYHEDMEETFILVRGEATMDVAGERVPLHPGDALVVSPREIHAMQNVGAQDVEYIVVGISLGQGGQTIVTDADASTSPETSFIA